MKYFLILFLILSVSSVKAIDWGNPDEQKALSVDFGLGTPGFSVGLGARYWIFGLSLGLIGIFDNIPEYSYIGPNNTYLNPYKPLPQGYVEQRYTSTLLNADLNIFFDYFYPVTLIGAIGYYSETDTILAYNIEYKSRYSYRFEKSSGLSMGLGIEYPLNDEFSVSALIHNKRGFIARILYYF